MRSEILPFQSGMVCHVDLVTSILKDCSAFIFQVQQSEKGIHLEMLGPEGEMALFLYETLGNFLTIRHDATYEGTVFFS